MMEEKVTYIEVFWGPGSHCAYMCEKGIKSLKPCEKGSFLHLNTSEKCTFVWKNWFGACLTTYMYVKFANK